jgi:hypothetical protein
VKFRRFASEDPDKRGGPLRIPPPPSSKKQEEASGGGGVSD